MTKKIWGWLMKLLADSLAAVLKQPLVLFLSSITLIAIVALDRALARTYFISGYKLAVLFVLALVGVVVSIPTIIDSILPKIGIRWGTTKKRIEKLKFEDFPREWRAQVWRAGQDWQIENIVVYCTIHNLLLHVNTGRADRRDARSNIVTTTICRDCQREGKRYQEDALPGYAVHSESSYHFVEEEVKSQFIRKLESEKQ